MSIDNDKKEAKAWTVFHNDGLPTSSGSDYLGENAEFFSRLIAGVSSGRMLDIGTGNMPIPRIARQLNNAALEVYAIDVADIKPEFHCEGVVFRRESSEATSFKDNFFDLVTGSYALEYSNVEKSLVEIMRIMKAGATAGFIMHHPDSIVVKRVLEANDNDVSLPSKMESLKVLERYVDNPSVKNRRRLESILKHLESQVLENDFNMFRGVVDAIRLILQGYAQGKPVTPDAFQRWLHDTLGKIKGTAIRHNLMVKAIVHDPEPIQASLEQLGAEILRFDTIESEVDLGVGPGGAKQNGLIGWALEFKKQAQQ